MLSERALLSRFYLFLIITFHVQQTDELTCFLISTHPKYIGTCRSEGLEWVFLIDITFRPVPARHFCWELPSASGSSAWPWKLFPKQSIPIQMWVSSTAHQLVPALCHPLVSFQCPSKLLPVLTASKGEADAWKDVTLRKRKLAGWLVQALWYKPGKERESPWCYWGRGSSQWEPCHFSHHWFFCLWKCKPKTCLQRWCELLWLNIAGEVGRAIVLLTRNKIQGSLVTTTALTLGNFMSFKCCSNSSNKICAKRKQSLLLSRGKYWREKFGNTRLHSEVITKISSGIMSKLDFLIGQGK